MTVLIQWFAPRCTSRCAPSCTPSRGGRPGRCSRSVLVVALVGLCLVVSPRVGALEVDAVITWAEPRALAIPVSGRVDAVRVEPGSVVAEGTELVRLDLRPFANAVRHSEAGVAEIAPDLAEAEREYARAQELYDRTVLSQVERQVAENRLRVLEARSEAAQARAAQARLAREYAVLRAPYPAHVMAVHTREGAVLSSALQPAPVVELARSDRRWAVGEAEAGAVLGAALALGDSVQVRVEGMLMAGEIQALRGLADVNTLGASIEVVVRVAASPSGRLPVPGAQARIIAP